MNIIPVTMITITKREANKGSKLIEFAVEVDGAPFGLIWRNKTTKASVDTWKVSFADGRPGLSGFKNYEDAEVALRGAI